ncbi:MAG TPA: hypothetical protein VIO37_12755 [Candidatus Dormibacteraeota bacterium]|jgi:hypothetical protein
MTTIIVQHKDSSAAPGFGAASASVEGTGEFRATIARFDAGPDKEGDVYASPAAFPIGKAVAVSAWMHKSWDAALPVGYAIIHANQHCATAVGRLFRDTFAGEQTYKTLMGLKAAGVDVEWSFGYDPTEVSFDDLPSGAKRRLVKMDVFEVSPVLVGAGIGTGTEDLKDDLDAQIAATRAYRDFLFTLQKVRDSGLFAPQSADDVARSAINAMRRAEQALRSAA